VSAPRTTSGVLAVVAAGLIATPASAADGAATNATTAATPPTLTDALDAITTPKAAATTAETPAPAPAPTPTTTDVAPTTTATTPAPTQPAPTTTGTTPAKPSDPKDPTVGDDSGGQGRDNAKAARERRQRAAERQRIAKERSEARAERREQRREARAKREAEAREAKKAREDAAGVAGTTTGAATTPAGVTSDGLDADTLLKAPTAVPNFFLDKFQIPPFLLPIYQAAGMQYGIRWEILAAINEIETNYGRNLNVSTAGALGWMQFMPPTWASYGVDANGDDQADPYNPVDAIFAAARYLKAAGADTDIRKAIFAYNHADWYVDSVMLRARLISGLPADLVGSLTGLTQGVFPVSGDATYAGAPKADEEDDAADGSTALATTDDAAKDEDEKDTQGGKSGPRRSITIDAEAGSDAVAVQDGTVTALGESDRLGRYVQLRDVFGNRYTYAHLDEVAKTYPAPADDTPAGDAAATDALKVPKDPAPSAPATAGRQRRTGEDAKATGNGDRSAQADGQASGNGAAGSETTSNGTDAADKTGADTAGAARHGALNEDGTAEVRTSAAAPAGPRVAEKPLFANPKRDGSRWGTGERPTTTAKAPAPGDLSATDPSATPPTAPKPAPATEEQPVSREGLVDRPLQRGARVVGGTVLGTVGRKPEATQAEAAPESKRAKMTFGVRPAGKGAPQIDPKPLLDGWKLLASTEVYRAKGENPLFGAGGSTASAGQVLLMSKAQLERRVLADDRLDIYPVGRQQIQAGQIDRRVLATLAFLSANGHRVGVSSLRRPGSITSAGNVSEHDSGNAIDISSVDGQVISPSTQGAGTITDRTIRLLLQLQGTMKPHQIISLMTASDFGGADNILPLPDHADHIHVGFHVEDTGSSELGQQLASALKPNQWDDLIARLGEIENPDVSSTVSKYALKTKRTKKDK
jgi:hypothetical protein